MKESPNFARKVYHWMGRPDFARRAYRWAYNGGDRLRHRVNHWAYVRTEGKRLRPLKDIHAGQRCFIIGNGPSLKMHDLTKLAGEKKFATNMFLLHPDWERIHLDFFCAVDPMHWQFESGFLEFWKQAFVQLPYCKFFFSRSAIPICQQTSELKDHEVYFVNFDQSRHVWRGDFSVDVASYTSLGWTVIVDLCLPLAYYFGFKEVFLLGCDCDYHIDEVPDQSRAFFYDRGGDPRPLDKWELGPERIELMFASYQVVKEVFEADGRKIYNAGYGGRLEVFPRVNYDDLF